MKAFNFSVPDQWYQGVYHDRKPCCNADRSFKLIHEDKADECWLIIHGYRGYPGELVRPATDLFGQGFDVFVPRFRKAIAENAHEVWAQGRVTDGWRYGEKRDCVFE